MNVLVDNNTLNSIIPNISIIKATRSNHHHIQVSRRNSHNNHTITEINIITIIKGVEQTTTISSIIATNRATKAISAPNRKCASKSWRDNGSKKENDAIVSVKGIPVVVATTAMIEAVTVVILTTTTSVPIITITNVVLTTTVNSAVLADGDVMKGAPPKTSPGIVRTERNHLTIDKGFVIASLKIFLFERISEFSGSSADFLIINTMYQY